MFNKRTFTLAGFARSLLFNLLYGPRLITSMIHPATSGALREQIMLGCTSVNDCRYCDWFHTQMALKNAVDLDELNQFLANPEGTSLPEDTAIAILYAQHFAENRGKVSKDARERLKTVFNGWQRIEINAYLHAIYLGNLSGNTFDAFMSRLRGAPKAGSSVVTELIVSVVAAPVLLLIASRARKANDSRFKSKSQSTEKLGGQNAD
jgi:AhpD family alkylhydroperoxidase